MTDPLHASTWVASSPVASECAATMGAMARMFVEGWAPEYGAPFDPDEQLAPAEGTIQRPSS